MLLYLQENESVCVCECGSYSVVIEHSLVLMDVCVCGCLCERLDTCVGGGGRVWVCKKEFSGWLWVFH